jgi:hypothetical protein
MSSAKTANTKRRNAEVVLSAPGDLVRMTRTVRNALDLWNWIGESANISRRHEGVHV